MVATSRLVSAAAIGAAVLVTQDAAADGAWYTSLNGPPTHTTQGMLGMGGVIANGGVGGPGLTGGFVYGIADPFAFIEISGGVTF